MDEFYIERTITAGRPEKKMRKKWGKYGDIRDFTFGEAGLLVILFAFWGTIIGGLIYGTILELLGRL